MVDFSLVDPRRWLATHGYERLAQNAIGFSLSGDKLLVKHKSGAVTILDGAGNGETVSPDRFEEEEYRSLASWRP